MAQHSPIISLWFNDQAEEAARFYTGVFGGEITDTTHFNGAGNDVTGGTPGQVLTVYFTINGAGFVALNGGKADWTFNEAISIAVPCDTQEEIDTLWVALTADGGQESQCGWLKDKYGVSWQVFPEGLDDLVGEQSAAGERAMNAMLAMTKIDKAAIEAAYKGE